MYAKNRALPSFVMQIWGCSGVIGFYFKTRNPLFVTFEFLFVNKVYVFDYQCFKSFFLGGFYVD